MGRKAEEFAQFAKDQGWKTSVTASGIKSKVIATSGAYKAEVLYRGEACVAMFFTGEDGERRRLRNPSLVRQRIEEAVRRPQTTQKRSAGTRTKPVSKRPAAAATTPRKPKPVARKSPPKEEPVAEPFVSQPKIQARLPFDPERSSDEKIIQAVLGKTITWRNVLAHKYETAVVMAVPNQRHLRIEVNARKQRCLTFAGGDPQNPRIPGEGFRSVRLSAIVQVK